MNKWILALLLLSTPTSATVTYEVKPERYQIKNKRTKTIMSEVVAANLITNNIELYNLMMIKKGSKDNERISNRQPDQLKQHNVQ